MNNTIISAFDEQFYIDCKVVSTKREYPSYTGIEKWIIITDLTEEELNERYAEQIAPLRPFIVLSRSFGEVRDHYIRNENKHRMRAYRTIEPFDYDDDLVAAHHAEIVKDSLEDELMRQFEYERLQQAIASLNPIQKRRLQMFFFENMSYAKIAEKEGIAKSAAHKSVASAIENVKSFLIRVND